MTENTERAAHHHHHRHRHHHKDEADLFKEYQLRVVQRRKQFVKMLYILACVLAALVSLGVLWVYTQE